LQTRGRTLFKSKLRMQSIKQEIGVEVWNAHLNMKETEERICSIHMYLENVRGNLVRAGEEYRDWTCSMIEVIDAETSLAAEDEGHIEALADFKTALTVLDQAAGSSLPAGIQGDK